MIRRLKAAGEGWVEDQAGQMGAALAYYTLFSLAPLLMLALWMLGVLYSEAESKEHVLTHVRGYLGPESADAIRGMIENFHQPTGQAAASLVGLGSLLFGATGMFTSLRSSLARIWRLPPVEESVIRGLMKTYLLAFLMVFVTCVFLLALLLVSAVSPVIASRWADRVPSIPWSGPAIDLAVSTLLLTLLLLFTFRFLSEGRLSYGRLWSGAFVSAVLFSVGKIAIGYYIAYIGLASAFGAAGSLVVFLAWVYYSAQIVFFGAEVVRAGLPGVKP